MTNQSPQEPQNPIPERRRKPAAGLTFDEMIGIFVAFSTIGAILFWTLGDSKSGLTGKFGLGGQNSLPSGENSGIGIGSINADSDVEFGELESEPGSFIPVAPSPQKLDDSLVKPTSKFYTVNPEGKLVPVTGVTVIPNSANRPNVNQNINSGNLNREKPVAAKPEAAKKPVAVKPEPVKKPVATKPQPAVPQKTEIPTDVVPSYWAYPFVKQMSDQGLVADLTENQDFEPNKLITRASMATLISQAFNQQPEVQQTKKFKDVSNGNEIAADVDKAVRMGFMQGYSDDEFRPLDNIPRYQVLVTLATGLGLKPSQDPEQILQKFDDGSNMPDWAKQQVAAAAEAGLIVNRPEFTNNSLNPNQSATRAEVAAMIHQALVKTGKLKSLDSEYIIKP
jgi:hypothetical protein